MTQSRSGFLRLAWSVLGLTILALHAPCRAHPPVSTIALMTIHADGGVHLTLIHDALAFALNDTSARIADPEMLALLHGPEEKLTVALADGRERLQSGLALRADGLPVPITIVEAPNADTTRRRAAEHASYPLPCTMSFVIEAKLPPAAREVTVRFPMVLADVLLSLDRPDHEPTALPLAPGETSPVIDVHIPNASAPTTTSSVPSSITNGPAASAPRETLSTWATAWRYTRLGYRHIIPEGTDHALFVLGLFLLSPRVKSVLWQITAFTIAHSVTLTLATLHLVTIPARIVEPTIALTIAFVAVENLFASRVRPWRAGAAFLFGLVHGLGFASGLMEIGLPAGQLATGLVAFNVGVEGGHLTVLLAAFAIMGWWRGRPWYRRWIAIPLSLVIASIAVLWFVQRLSA